MYLHIYIYIHTQQLKREKKKVGLGCHAGLELIKWNLIKLQ